MRIAIIVDDGAGNVVAREWHGVDERTLEVSTDPRQDEEELFSQTTRFTVSQPTRERISFSFENYQPASGPRETIHVEPTS